MLAPFSRRVGFALIAITAAAMMAPSAALADGNREIAAPEQAAQMVSDLSNRVLALLGDESLPRADRDKRLRALLDEGFNMKYIALLTLGPYRRHVTQEELTAYEELFAGYMLAKYAALLNSYSGEQLVISGAQPAGRRDALVRSQIETANGTPIEAEWRVRVFSGKPRIIDLKVAGLSLAQSQREEFSAVINRSGFDGLIEILRSSTPAENRA